MSGLADHLRQRLLPAGNHRLQSGHLLSGEHDAVRQCMLPGCLCRSVEEPLLRSGDRGLRQHLLRARGGLRNHHAVARLLHSRPRALRNQLLSAGAPLSRAGRRVLLHDSLQRSLLRLARPRRTPRDLPCEHELVLRSRQGVRLDLLRVPRRLHVLRRPVAAALLQPLRTALWLEMLPDWRGVRRDPKLRGPTA